MRVGSAPCRAYSIYRARQGESGTAAGARGPYIVYRGVRGGAGSLLDMSFSVLTMLAPSAPSRLLGVRSGGRGAEECVHFGGVCVCFAGARGDARPPAERVSARRSSGFGYDAAHDNTALLTYTTTQAEGAPESDSYTEGER